MVVPDELFDTVLPTLNIVEPNPVQLVASDE